MKRRRVLLILSLIGISIIWLLINPKSYEQLFVHRPPSDALKTDSSSPLARDLLSRLAVKGRAPKTGYTRAKFYQVWPEIDGCSLRQRIIKREFTDTAKHHSSDQCTVISGEFIEPYTGQKQTYQDKKSISKNIQIDHVVALSDAWQKGARELSSSERYALATDPLNLLAADAKANQAKSDSDAASWLPPNKSFRCQYVARQISVKYKYHLWVTSAELNAIIKVLDTCPGQLAIGIPAL